MNNAQGFTSWLDFINFEVNVKYLSRYLLSQKARLFLDALYESSEVRHITLSKGTTVWRAQAGCIEGRHDGAKWEDPRPYEPVRMKPLNDSAHEGRANPKGMPCLYAASDKETAMSEIRPWLGESLTLGQFQLAIDLKLVDCSVAHSAPFGPPMDERSKSELVENIWSQVDRAFSQPVSASPSTAEYVPTQIIAELFRSKGFGGISYKSKLGPGLNFALFDIEAATLRACSVVKVKKILFEFGELEHSYFVDRLSQG